MGERKECVNRLVQPGVAGRAGPRLEDASAARASAALIAFLDPRRWFVLAKIMLGADGSRGPLFKNTAAARATIMKVDRAPRAEGFLE